MQISVIKNENLILVITLKPKISNLNNFHSLTHPLRLIHNLAQYFVKYHPHTIQPLIIVNAIYLAFLFNDVNVFYFFY
jgi:hypothetical protein